jgi:hypothetical protein
MFFNNVLAEVIGISVLYFFDSYTLRESDDLFNCYYGRQRLFPTHTCARSLDFFETYEAIIYAGWCMAGMVVKVKWFFERAAYWKNKKLSIVAVGASPNDNPEVDEFLNNLFTDEQRPFIKAGTIIKRYACSCLRYVEGYGHFFVARNIFD